MSKLVFILLAIIGGMFGGSQAPINGELGKRIGSFEAAWFSFFIGTLFLTLVTLFLGKGHLLKLFSVPKWNLLGGFSGALLVTCIIIAVPKLGVALTIFAAIIGQITISMIIDHFGLFGIERIPFNWNRFIGLSLMIIALFLIYRDRIIT
ncbi:DMT family transporter [Bacillus timonensis]|nr:DMT family transporter [Bacillus timonensis]